MKEVLHQSRQQIIFIVGSGGTGKTTIAKEMVKQFDCVFLDKDTVGGRYSDLILQMNGQDINDRDSAFYQQHCRDMEYVATMDVAVENLALGKHIMLIGPFGKELLDPTWIVGQLARAGKTLEEVSVSLIHVYLSDLELQKQRIIQRNHPRDAWKIANWDEFSKRIKGLQEFKCNWNEQECSILHLDNSKQSIEENVEKALDFLSLGELFKGSRDVYV